MQRHIRKQRCPACGEPHWFKDWVGRFCAKSKDGLCVSDFDLVFHRFRISKDALGQRDVEHLMVVEVKTENETLGAPQRDTLSAANAIFNAMIPVDGKPIKVQSRPGFIRAGTKKLIWHGAHLLRVPAKESTFGPFWWDAKPIESGKLIGVLNFELDARHPYNKLDIERRHKAASVKELIGQSSLFSKAI